MTQAFVSGVNMVFPRTCRDTLERNVPIIRLKDDAHLREIYEFGRELGQGSFGVVYEATHIETQTKWAIKKVCRPAPGSRKVKMLDDEIMILKQVNHDHIIHLKEVYNTNKAAYLVTELCVGGDLKQLLQQKKFFTEDETKHIIRSLADAVVYLHRRNIVHRDLKLENILVRNYLDAEDNGRINIKVIDFGLSVKTGGARIEDVMTEACGTPIYMAPEMMSGHGYTEWCDVWSIGVIMYMLLCGEPPFVSKTKEKLLKEILSKEVKFTQQIWATVSDTAKTLLTCLLKADPAYRMSAKQLLENPWITGDTNVPVMPFNVLEMMRTFLEEKDRGQTLEDLSLTSSEGTLDSSTLPRVASTETEGSRGRPAERDSSSCSPSTSAKPSKEKGSCLQRGKCKNSSETPGSLQPTTTTTTTTQSHASVKPSTQTSTKRHKPRDKKDISTGQKAGSELCKTDNHRPSTSSKSRTGPRKL